MPDAEGFRALMERLAGGDDAAAQAILTRYGPHLLKVIRRKLHPALRPIVDSGDFLQSVWGSLVRLGPGMDRIQDPDHLMKMLVVMARNKIVNEMRQRTETERYALPTQCTRDEIERAWKLNEMPLPPTASQFAIARERWERILEDQPEICQKLLTLRLSGYTYEEIALELGINERSARRIIARLMDQETISEQMASRRREKERGIT